MTARFSPGARVKVRGRSARRKPGNNVGVVVGLAPREEHQTTDRYLVRLDSQAKDAEPLVFHDTACAKA